MDGSSKLLRKIRHYGPHGAFKQGIKRFWQRLLKVELVFQAPDEPVSKETKELTFQVIYSDSAEADARLERYFCHRRLSEAKQRLASGRTLVLCLIHGELAAYGWGQNQHALHFSYVGSGLEFDREVLYVFDCRTLQRFRGRGLFSAVLSRFVALAGDRECYVACRSNNISSVKGINKAGFRLYARLYLLNLYFFRVTFSARQQV